MPPKGRGKKAQGASGASTLKNWAKKITSKRQPSVNSPQALDLSMELDSAEGGIQAMDRDGLDSVMDIRMDISSYLEAMEHGIEILRVDRTTANGRGSQSPSKAWKGSRTG